MRITRRREGSSIRADVMDIMYIFKFLSLTLSGIGMMQYIRNTREKWELLGTEALQENLTPCI